MQNTEGVKVEDVKAPDVKPVEIKPEEKKPDAPAGEQKKEDGAAEALQAAEKALGAAENRIVELKRQLKNSNKGGEGNPDLEELRNSVQALTEEVEALKSARVPKEDADRTVEELQATRKKLSEVSAALVSKNTAGKGEGGGVNKDQIQPPTEEKPLAKTPEEVAILARRGLDKFGKKIK